jgi:hypothetical protein
MPFFHSTLGDWDRSGINGIVSTRWQECKDERGEKKTGESDHGNEIWLQLLLSDTSFRLALSHTAPK